MLGAQHYRLPHSPLGIPDDRSLVSPLIRPRVTQFSLVPLVTIGIRHQRYRRPNGRMPQVLGAPDINTPQYFRSYEYSSLFMTRVAHTSVYRSAVTMTPTYTSGLSLAHIPAVYKPPVL